MNNEFRRTAMRVSVISIITNIVLSLFKLIAGLIAHSGAMISDAIHSASDVFSTFVVMAGVKMSDKTPDREHPYGHERMECVAAIILSTVLVITGLGLGYSAAVSLISGAFNTAPMPGLLAAVAAGVSIATKEWMYHYTKINAKKIDSGALMADAWHHRSDALSSVGALIGIGAARLGFPAGDAVASLIICILIVKASYDIFKDAVDKMVDKACDEEYENEIRACVMKNENVLGIDLLRTRVFGNKVYVDIEISLDGEISLCNAHEIAEQVHDDIESEFPKIKHIMIHTQPRINSDRESE